MQYRLHASQGVRRQPIGVPKNARPSVPLSPDHIPLDPALRKVAIPLSADMPAPVKTTSRRAPLMSLAARSLVSAFIAMCLGKTPLLSADRRSCCGGDRGRGSRRDWKVSDESLANAQLRATERENTQTIRASLEEAGQGEEILDPFYRKDRKGPGTAFLRVGGLDDKLVQVWCWDHKIGPTWSLPG